jgi:hypothetical protein
LNDKERKINGNRRTEKSRSYNTKNKIFLTYLIIIRLSPDRNDRRKKLGIIIETHPSSSHPQVVIVVLAVVDVVVVGVTVVGVVVVGVSVVVIVSVVVGIVVILLASR